MVKLTRLQVNEQRNNPVTALQVSRAYSKLFGHKVPPNRSFSECASDIVKHFQNEYKAYLFIREQSNVPNDE